MPRRRTPPASSGLPSGDCRPLDQCPMPVHSDPTVLVCCTRSLVVGRLLLFFLYLFGVAGRSGMHENIPTLPVSDWSGTRIYLRFLCLIGPAREYT
eukprot:3071184-Pyramimonas_sp.AAC.2